MPVFERHEYLARIDKVKTRMAAAGIDTLLAADPANMNYLTGYDGWSFYTPQVAVVSAALAEPVVIVRLMDANGAKVTTFLDHGNIVGYPDRYVQSTERHPMDFIAEEIERRGLGRGVIGLEMDAYYFTAAAVGALTRGLPNARFKDATALVNWVRVVKSPRELQYMSEAARIVEKVMATAFEAIRPGVRQCDAAALIYKAEIEGTPEFGGDYTAFVPMLPTGIGTSTPHLTWSDRPFVAGEATILELAACRHRYHCPMARTMFLGSPPPRLADTAAAVVEGLNAALEAARPGVTAEEVEAAWRRAIAKSGLTKESRIGYSVGLNYPPDWGEHTLSLRPGDRTVLQADMTLHCIPGIWMDDWGFEVSECFRVTPSGGEPFARVPQALYLKG